MNIDDLFQKSVEIDNEIFNHKHDATILFADLVGSTEFKTKTDLVLGLKKTYIHNSIITDIVEKNGEVVKYIGDEVMAIFKSENHCQEACQVAIEIQKAIEKTNKQYSQSPMLPIQSKIGLHSGDVLYWEYSAQKGLDPQGSAVDYAARIVSLACGNQIICSNETYQRLHTSNAIVFSKPKKVYLKGISKQMTVFEIIHDGTEKEITAQPLKLSFEKDLRQTVKSGIDALEVGKIDLAEQLFERAVKKHPLDFIANFYYGIVLSRYKNKPEQALEFFEKSLETNPEEPLSWFYIGFLEWYINKDLMTNSQIEKAIYYTEKCLLLTETRHDYTTRRNAKANLAFFYKQRNNGDDLANAVKLCEEVKRQYDIIEKHCYIGFLDTYADVLIQKGSKDDLVIARKNLEEVLSLDPAYPYAHANMAKLVSAEKNRGITKNEGPLY